MAYITQYQLDMEKQRRLDQGQNAAMDGFQNVMNNIEENRRRAVDEKRKQGELAFKLAEEGVSAAPEELEEFSKSGMSQSLFDKYAKKAEEARLRKIDSEDTDRKWKHHMMGIKVDSYQTPEEKAAQELKTHADKIAITQKAEDEKSKNSKKPLSAEMVIKVNEGALIPNMLKDVESTILNNEGLFSPIGGTIRGMNPFDEKGKTAQAQLKAAAQAFGKFMEGGVLRKEDEAKYEKMFPQIGETPAVAKNKLDIVQRLLKNKSLGDLEALRKSGYDVSGIGAVGAAPSIPQVLNPQAPQAPAIDEKSELEMLRQLKMQKQQGMAR